MVSIDPNSLHPEKSPISTAHTDLYLKRHAWGTRSFYCGTMKTQNCRIYRVSFRPSVQAKRDPRRLTQRAEAAQTTATAAAGTGHSHVVPHFILRGQLRTSQ